MYDAEMFPSIKHQIINYYGSYISPEEQIRRIVTDPTDASRLISAGKSMNNYSSTAKLARNYGIRGLMYEWDGVATVLPFDFSSVVVWAVAKNARIDARLVKVFDRDARERYERNFDWDFQLWGRYGVFPLLCCQWCDSLECKSDPRHEFSVSGPVGAFHGLSDAHGCRRAGDCRCDH